MEQIAVNFIRDYAYQNGDAIYKFMDHYNIGKSAYGKLMDFAGREKGVMAHRLFGHHIIFDFPVDDTENIAPFLEHLGSDLFTKMGLPIIPGEVLEDNGLLDVCKSLNNNWNFVNGFDILSGTVSIYSGYCNLKDTFYREMPVQDFEAVAKTFGISAINLAIAMSSCNPFLLLGSMMSFTAGVRGMFNTGARIYFENFTNVYSLKFALNDFSLEADLGKFSVDMEAGKYGLDENLKMYSIDEVLNRIIYDSSVQ